LKKRGRVLSAEDRFAIKALHDAWLDAEVRGDSSALLQLCTAAPVWLPPNEAPLCGRAAILRWLAEQPHTDVRRIDIDDLAMSGVGSFAWKLATFRATFEGPADAGARVVTGSHGWLLQRDEMGAWRVGVVIWAIEGTEGV
jgi:ketosteroid isomerase-like protein